MNKAALLKIILFSTLPFVVLTLLFFFLYPYINKERYQQIVERHESGLYEDQDSTNIGSEGMEESFTIIDSLIASAIGSGIDSSGLSMQEFNILKIEKVRLQKRVDSLTDVAYQQKQVIDEQQTRLNELESAAVSEDFVTRVKSMLNLEVEELSPILRKFGDDELVKIYVNSGNMQREKILRALDPAKAADLMSEVML